jgi:hypothetical protein
LLDVRQLPRLFAGSIASLMLAISAFGLEIFPEVVQSHEHCPADIVVRLNLPTMIWHYKGQRWYARTRHGAFACEKKAAASGARGTTNGQ